MQLNFEKYQGAGNDFVVLDVWPEGFLASDISKLCDRRFGIGADGLMVLKPCLGYDFELFYYNADGRLGSLCGNGSRCAVAYFLAKNRSHTGLLRFLAADGPHLASKTDSHTDTIKLEMASVDHIQKTASGYYLNTGSPHLICFTDELAAVEVNTLGSSLRHYPDYAQYGGVNVNFVQLLSDTSFAIRTYERGVEAETLACGTGTTAAAIALHHAGHIRTQTLTAHAKGGILQVDFEHEAGHYHSIYLSGPAQKVFEGQINV